MAILDNTATPTKAFATPSLDDFTEVTGAGSYTTGGTSLGTYTSMISEAAGVMTFDSATPTTWAADASNDVDAYWALIYNDTIAGNDAIAFIDLGGPVDMVAGSLTVTLGGSGIFTITNP